MKRPVGILIRLLILASFAVAMTSLFGCAKLMGNLRRDLDDSDPPSAPTVGGRWSERNQLEADDDRYDAIGHSERNPASDMATPDRGGSWVTPEEAETAQRDRYRGAGDDDGENPVSMSNTPTLDPPVKRMYKNGSRATRADFIDDSPNEGSLWGSDGQTNYYFTKNKVRGVGDIITVTMEADMIKDVATEVKRTLSPHERDYELAAAQQRLQLAAMGGAPADGTNKDQVASSAAAPASAPGAQPSAAPNPKDVQVREATTDDIDVSKSLAIKAGDTMMAEILERYPNGNYKIRGTKRIAYKGGRPRMVNLIGIARAQDIGEDDTIASGKLYEYRLEATH